MSLRCDGGYAWPVKPIATLLLLFATAARAVAGEDQIAEPGTPAELGAIGVVTRPGSQTTGFLVGACEVLTTKHSAGWVGKTIGNRMRFAQAGKGGRRSHGVVIAEGNLDLFQAWYSADRRGDWLLLRLDRCLGRTIRPVDLSTTPIYVSGHWAPGSPALQLAGFPGARRWQDGITRDPDCRVRGPIDGQFLNDCASRPGNSGSPLFAFEGEGAERRLVVFAMQSLGEPTAGPASPPLLRHNVAVPMSAVVPLIAAYLTYARITAASPPAVPRIRPAR